MARGETSFNKAPNSCVRDLCCSSKGLKRCWSRMCRSIHFRPKCRRAVAFSYFKIHWFFFWLGKWSHKSAKIFNYEFGKSWLHTVCSISSDAELLASSICDEIMSWSNRKEPSRRNQVCNVGDKWSDNKMCRLVCFYRKYPCLWNKDSPSYMDNSKRHSAYSNIHQGMDMPHVTFTEVMIKIREVRRIYVNELKKIIKARRSGSKYEPPQKWFLTLHNFLYKYLDFDETSELKVSTNVVFMFCISLTNWGNVYWF